MVKLRKILSKKTSRSIKNNWAQFLAIIGIATLAMTLFLGLFASAESFESRVNSFYKDGNLADLWLTTELGSEETYSDMYRFIDTDGEINRRGIFQTLVNSKSSYALVTERYPTICAPVMDTTVSKKDENGYLILDERFASDNNIKIGDKVEISMSLATIAAKLEEEIHGFEGVSFTAGIFPIEIPSYADLKEKYPDLDDKLSEFFTDLKNETPSLEFEVTHKMKFAENIQNGSYSIPNYLISYKYLENRIIDYLSTNYDIKNLGEEIYNYIKIIGKDTKSVLKYALDYKINGDRTVRENIVSAIQNQYLFKLGAEQKASDVKERLENYLKDKELTGYVMDRETSPFNSIVQADIKQAKQLTYVFPLVFFLVSVLVICTTISQLIVKERMQIGTLKAMGLTKRQILVHYLSLMLVLMFVGVAIGTIVGPILIPNIMNIKYDILYTLPAIKYVFPILPFLISGAIVFAVTFLVVFLVCRKELNLTPSESMRPALPKTLKAKKTSKNKLFSLKMAFRNIRLNIVKSLMVVVGIAGCTSLLVCGFGIDDTLDNGIAIDLDIYYSSDAILTYNSGSSSLLEDIKNVEGVDKDNIDEMMTYSSTIRGDKGTDSFVYVVNDSHPFFKVDFSKDDVAISNKVSKSTGLEVGDEIDFEIFGTTYTSRVGVIFESFSKHGIVVNASNPEYQDLFIQRSSAWVNVLKGYNVDEVLENIKEQVSGVTSYSTRDQTVGFINDIMSSISNMTLTVKVFAILLAVVVLYNLIYLNYKERIREMATLKVIGFKNGETSKSLIIESMFLVLIGVIVGCFLGYPLEHLVLSINSNAIVEFLYTVTFSTYLLSFTITFVTAFILNLLLSLLVRKIKMVESLKSVE